MPLGFGDVAALVEAGARVNETDGDGCSALFLFSEQGNLQVVTELIAANADVNQANNDGATPLHMACQEGRTEVVAKLLAANANVNQANNHGDTALIVASYYHHAEIVNTLLAANANVDQVNGAEAATPLFYACRQGHTEVVMTLLAANANVDLANNHGATPLYVACQQGRTEVVEKLLAANASVDRAVNGGMTPMFWASHNGDIGIVQLLSSYGASRTFTFANEPEDAPVETVEDLATDEGRHDLAGWLVTSRHWTALHHLEVLTPERASALLLGGAGVHAGDPTPLDRAKELCSSGRAYPGSAAHVVLEWGAPWSRTTHKFYPPRVRARAAALMRIAQAIKRGKAAYEADGVFVAFASPAAVADVFESCVIPHLISSDVWR